MKRLAWTIGMVAVAVSAWASDAAADTCDEVDCVTIGFCHAACSRCAVPDGSLETQKKCLWP